jgi:gluconolactonase
MKKTIFCLIAIMAISACKSNETKTELETTEPIGTIERIDPALDALVDENATVEIIAEGHDWTEGPLWIESESMLLFSDIPKNSIYKWTEDQGEELYLTPCGYTGNTPRGGETGSNGLLLNPEGKLVLCQHGDRRMALMDAPLNDPAPNFITLAGSYDGKKFNSPNDAAYRSNGDLFFTDPPYGLEKRMEDPLKEMDFQGVYKMTPDGTITLLIDSVTRPNGIAFLPDEKTLIVANSDPEKAVWYAFDLGENDVISNARIFYDATAESKAGAKGLPDGLKIDKGGNLFATGPGGIWIFNSEGKVLGKIKMREHTSNCSFADDEKTLYATADDYVVRIKLR